MLFKRSRRERWGRERETVIKSSGGLSLPVCFTLGVRTVVEVHCKSIRDIMDRSYAFFSPPPGSFVVIDIWN